MKLSEKLAKLEEADGTLGPVYGVLADEARALEERVAALEKQALAWATAAGPDPMDGLIAQDLLRQQRDSYKKEVEDWRTIALNHSTDAVVFRQQRDAANARAEAAEANLARVRELAGHYVRITSPGPECGRHQDYVDIIDDKEGGVR